MQKIYSLDWPHDPRYCIYLSPNKHISFIVVVDQLFRVDIGALFSPMTMGH